MIAGHVRVEFCWRVVSGHAAGASHDLASSDCLTGFGRRELQDFSHDFQLDTEADILMGRGSRLSQTKGIHLLEKPTPQRRLFKKSEQHSPA